MNWKCFFGSLAQTLGWFLGGAALIALFAGLCRVFYEVVLYFGADKDNAVPLVFIMLVGACAFILLWIEAYVECRRGW